MITLETFGSRKALVVQTICDADKRYSINYKKPYQSRSETERKQFYLNVSKIVNIGDMVKAYQELEQEGF